jgi:hypothetical protein
MLGIFTFIPIFFNVYSNTEGRITLFPDFFISPIGILRRGVYHRIEGFVFTPVLNDIQSLLMLLPADGFFVRTRRGNNEVQRLRPRHTAPAGHNVKEPAILLCVQFVENQSMDVESVFGIRFRAENLIKTVQWFIYQLLLRRDTFYMPLQLRALVYHIFGHAVDDIRLIAVTGA